MSVWCPAQPVMNRECCKGQGMSRGVWHVGKGWSTYIAAKSHEACFSKYTSDHFTQRDVWPTPEDHSKCAKDTPECVYFNGTDTIAYK